MHLLDRQAKGVKTVVRAIWVMAGFRRALTGIPDIPLSGLWFIVVEEEIGFDGR